MTTMCLGTLGNASAPADDTMRFSSTGTPLSGIGSEPVATMMLAAPSTRSPPSASVTVTSRLPDTRPAPAT